MSLWLKRAGEVTPLTLSAHSEPRRANTLLSAPIFSLAFGRRTDFNMLRLLSVQNNGFARKIYTAADASLQMEGFYKGGLVLIIIISIFHHININD